MSDRLQKVMAHDGIASRRKSEEMILEGRVKVNGILCKELGMKVNNSDQIEVDGVPISKEEPVHYLLYKPRRVISSVKDEKKRKTVVDLLENVEERVYPVGRLDYNTSGILLMTNDGDFDYQITHPKFKITKTYVAKVEGVPTPSEIKQIQKGIMVENSKIIPENVKMISHNDKKNAIIRLTIHEGKNHIVKKIFEAINHPVEKLKREKIGNLGLGNMQPGDFRRLKKFEIDELLEITNKK